MPPAGKESFQIVFEWMADEAGGVGVLDKSGEGIERAGDADSDCGEISCRYQFGSFDDNPVESGKNSGIAVSRW